MFTTRTLWPCRAFHRTWHHLRCSRELCMSPLHPRSHRLPPRSSSSSAVRTSSRSAGGRRPGGTCTSSASRRVGRARRPWASWPRVPAAPAWRKARCLLLCYPRVHHAQTHGAGTRGARNVAGRLKGEAEGECRPWTAPTAARRLLSLLSAQRTHRWSSSRSGLPHMASSVPAGHHGQLDLGLPCT